jgi:predicted nucleic acid-binding protein
MNVIADTSVILAVILNEPTKPILVELTKEAELVAPTSIHFEIGNALSAMFRRRRVTLEQAIEAVRIYQSIPLRFVGVDLIDSLQIAHQLNIYAYDAYLIRCAEKYRAPLLTLDGALRRRAVEYGVQIMEVEG